MPSRRPWWKKPVFSTVYAIGVYTGPTPLALGPPAGLENPVLTRESVTDRYASFVADPFMIRVDGTWNMFFEVLACGTLAKKGEIGLATSRDGLRWAYQRIVLAEPFHLSYPHVFAWGSEHYLIPESAAAGGVRLYRADPFPTRWTLAAVLLEGPVLLDSSVFHRDGRWWMFTETDAARGTLRLFHARELTGPWREHPRSPIVTADPRTARPAGRVLATPDRLVRFAQDCELDYGVAVRAFEITRLNEREYEEHEVGGGPLLAAGAEGWRALGMHHLDVHPREEGGFIACVDGWRERARRPRELAIWAADHGRQALGLTRAARSRRPR